MSEYNPMGFNRVELQPTIYALPTSIRTAFRFHSIPCPLTFPTILLCKNRSVATVHLKFSSGLMLLVKVVASGVDLGSYLGRVVHDLPTIVS